jgi:hypothetical protein
MGQRIDAFGNEPKGLPNDDQIRVRRLQPLAVERQPAAGILVRVIPEPFPRPPGGRLPILAPAADSRRPNPSLPPGTDAVNSRGRHETSRA